MRVSQRVDDVSQYVGILSTDESFNAWFSSVDLRGIQSEVRGAGVERQNIFSITADSGPLKWQ